MSERLSPAALRVIFHGTAAPAYIVPIPAMPEGVYEIRAARFRAIATSSTTDTLWRSFTISSTLL
jgi:hypothetical protein